MSHRWLAILTIGFLALVVFVLFAIRLQPVWTVERLREGIAASNIDITEPTVSFVNPKKGSAEPSLVLVEFGDFQCAACKDFAEALDVILRTEPSVQVVWKNMPNESAHPLATPAAIAAHCAGEQEKFWEYHDALFDRQVVLTEALFPQIAQTLELDVDRWQRCYDARETLPLVKRDFEEALALEIAATPALFIGEDRYIGARTADELLLIIRQKLAAP
jgi:protein-disulfide isomerase